MNNVSKSALLKTLVEAEIEKLPVPLYPNLPSNSPHEYLIKRVLQPIFMVLEKSGFKLKVESRGADFGAFYCMILSGIEALKTEGKLVGPIDSPSPYDVRKEAHPFLKTMDSREINLSPSVIKQLNEIFENTVKTED